MTSEVKRAASELESDREARIEKLEADLRRIASEKRKIQQEKRDSSREDNERDSSEALVDVGINLLRSAIDAQFEFVRAVSRIFERSAEQAQSELRADDESDRRDSLSRIPSAVSKAITRSLEDQGRAADDALDRFTESFRSGRRRTRARDRVDRDN